MRVRPEAGRDRQRKLRVPDVHQEAFRRPQFREGAQDIRRRAISESGQGAPRKCVPGGRHRVLSVRVKRCTRLPDQKLRDQERPGPDAHSSPTGTGAG